MDECRELESLARDILSRVNNSNLQNNNSHKDDNNNNNSDGEKNGIYGGSGQRQQLEAKKMFASFGVRLKALSESLTRPHLLASLTDGEILRRRDLLESLKFERDRISRQISTVAQTQERSALLFQSTQSQNQNQQKRVFGVPMLDELEDVKHLDAGGLLELQQEMMQTQDDHLDNLYSSIVRQKDLSLMIGDELDTQNRLLVDLEQKVDNSQTRLKGATKAAEKLS
jgi:hypothetical protein